MYLDKRVGTALLLSLREGKPPLDEEARCDEHGAPRSRDDAHQHGVAEGQQHRAAPHAQRDDGKDRRQGRVDGTSQGLVDRAVDQRYDAVTSQAGPVLPHAVQDDDRVVQR